jgi:hypothetical protein
MLMAHTLVRIFDTLNAAEQARKVLLSSGFPPDSVHLDGGLDEAGPVEGNFLLPDKDTGTGPRDGSIAGVFGAEKHTDAYNKDQPVWRGNFKLLVDAEDDMQSARAADIMETFGAVDIDRRRQGG